VGERNVAFTRALPFGAINLTYTEQKPRELKIVSSVILDEVGLPVPQGTPITLNVQGGTLDVYESADFFDIPGIQVPTESDGTISFIVQLAEGSGLCNITVNSVEGTAYGELVIDYAPKSQVDGGIDLETLIPILAVVGIVGALGAFFGVRARKNRKFSVKTKKWKL
jgi:hypothetical protein